MSTTLCPLNNFQPCKSDCNWYIKKDNDCAIPLIAVYTNNPPKDKE